MVTESPAKVAECFPYTLSLWVLCFTVCGSVVSSLAGSWRGGRKSDIVQKSIIQGSHASWKVLENHFGPGKSWKLKLKVLESPRKISLKVMHFSSGSNGKQAAIV